MTKTFGFELVRDERIEELNTVARMWRHQKTGAQLLSLENDDENKVFGVSFRTVPADSTGVAHILEHAVLGGSQKYPLKEPFVQLIKGSLNTFLNTFTSPDKTTYPVASTNLQDFYNLVDVYLDAIFHPLLTPHHLDQEGWHYELEQADEPLVYRGVVYNEMKGVYSSPDAVLYRASQRALFPDNTYGVDSGGDPLAIPALTYEQFRHFYTTHYHPANALICFYGDDDPAERLRLLDEVLRSFDPAPATGVISLQTPFAAPRSAVVHYGVDPGTELGKKAVVQVNWALPEVTDPTLTMALNVLSYALMGTQASPLRKALVDSGLGEDVTGGGLGMGLRQPTFSAGLKGIVAADADRAEALIMETLSRLCDEGFDPELIEAAVNTIEFNLRENNTGSFPRGLGLFMRALRTWLHDQDPLSPLRYETPLAAVKQHLATAPDLLQQLIRTYLLANTHRVTVRLEPDPALNQAQEAAEKARLAAAKAAMSPAAIRAVIANTQALQLRQQTPDRPEDLAKLPTLLRSDLDRQNKLIPRTVADLPAGGKLLWHDLFTNGILYFRVGFDLQALPPDLLPYAEFFGKALLEMGTEKEDYVKLSQRIGRKTGGMSYSTFVAPMQENPAGAAWLFLSGKATVAQTPALLAILRDVLTEVKLDNPHRFKQIVLKVKARLEASLAPSGHSYVGGRLRAMFNTAGWAEEQMDGIDFLFFVRRLVEEMDRDWPGVLAKLEQVKAELIDGRRLVVDATVDGANWAQLEPQVMAFLQELPLGNAVAPGGWQRTLPASDEGLAIPAQVNFVGKAANLYDLGYTQHGSILAITNFIRTGWLWDQVRAKGGAYGAFCSFGRQSGLFTFLSYRDPNLANTLAAYDGTAHFLRTSAIDEGELTKTIIGAVRELDAYQLPDAKGMSSLVRYLLGESDAARQQLRDELLSTEVHHFRAFADVLDAMQGHARVVVMGAQETLAGAPLAITRVM